MQPDLALSRPLFQIVICVLLVRFYSKSNLTLRATLLSVRYEESFANTLNNQNNNLSLPFQLKSPPHNNNNPLKFTNIIKNNLCLTNYCSLNIKIRYN